MQTRDNSPPPGPEPPSARWPHGSSAPGEGGLGPERIEALRQRIREGAHNRAWMAGRVARRILERGHL